MRNAVAALLALGAAGLPVNEMVEPITATVAVACVWRLSQTDADTLSAA